MQRPKSITPYKTEVAVVLTYALFCTGAAFARQPQPEIVENTNFDNSVGLSIDSSFVEATSKDWVIFQNLAREWRNERGAMSSITQMSMLKPYQTIIGMGDKAVPLILAQLRSEGDDPDQWFWALRAITQENPVQPGEQGDFRAMAQAWFRWAEEEGYGW
jgi:hypothetical protein